MKYLIALGVLFFIAGAGMASAHGYTGQITVIASKVVCDSESLLPNWGGGGPDITSTTASNYVAAHQGCHLESGWNFQWAPGGTSNPGDNIGAAGGAWHTFGPTDQSGQASVTLNMTTSVAWFREVLKQGYTTFTGNSNSAEMYCGTDVMEYDNYEFINYASSGTFYCVAFNSVAAPACAPGYTGNYQCFDSWRQREYRNGDCSTVWINYQLCDYGCSQGVCQSGCQPGYLGNYRCDGNWSQREYQNPNCTTSWLDYSYCSLGCSQGACLQGCDEGYTSNYDCYNGWVIREFTLSDCSTEWYYYEECEYGCSQGACQDGCSPRYLDNYKCNGDRVERKYINGDCTYTWKDQGLCSDGCSNGHCISVCDPGYTSNYQCSGNWRQRGYRNGNCDVSWENYEYCSSGCTGGSCKPNPDGYCEDSDGGKVYGEQGNTYGITGSQSFSKQDECDGDVLTEFYCSNGTWAETEYTCSGNCIDGQCTSGAACSDECTYGEQECSSSHGYRRCDFWDSDVCTDWRVYPCDSDEECVSGGYCRYEGDDDDCDAGYENEYRCSGSWRQRLYTQSDCDEEWRNYEYCSYGCSSERCNAAVSPFSGAVSPTSYCGDGFCNGGESCGTCQTDCGQCQVVNFCGDGSCNNGESCSTCVSDCGACPILTYCGDATCNGAETCATCATDCGACQLCGDGVCTGSESCSTCSSDCGVCMNVCGVEIGEDVEVTATACLELRGFGTSQFNVTIYNREDHSVVYQIDLEGEAAAWSSVSSPSVRVPDYGSGQFAIMVSVPEGVPQGLYNLTAVIRSGGDVILTKQLYVSVAEPTEPGQQPVAVIQETPTGAVVLGEMDIMWVLVGLAVVINLALLVILIKKRQG